MIEDDDTVGAIPVWHVVFMQSREPHPWDIFTRPGYRHVAAYGYSASQGVWVVVDPAQGIMKVQVLDEDGLAAWVRARSEYIAAILRMPARRNVHLTSRFGHICVTAIKQLLGLKSGAFTPHGLFRHMQANGAEEVFCGRPPPKRSSLWSISIPDRLKPKPREKPANAPKPRPTPATQKPSRPT